MPEVFGHEATGDNQPLLQMQSPLNYWCKKLIDKRIGIVVTSWNAEVRGRMDPAGKLIEVFTQRNRSQKTLL